jgi:hypothetical protein
MSVQTKKMNVDSGMAKIQIEAMSGGVHNVEMEKSKTIADLKREIQTLTRIPFEQQVLFGVPTRGGKGKGRTRELNDHDSTVRWLQSVSLCVAEEGMSQSTFSLIDSD